MPIPDNPDQAEAKRLIRERAREYPRWLSAYVRGRAAYLDHFPKPELGPRAVFMVPAPEPFIEVWKRRKGQRGEGQGSPDEG